MLPPSSERAAIVLAASPGNSIAQQLAAALRQRGHVVTILTVAAAHESGAQVSACAVVLADGEVDDPIVHAAISADCPILIPIIASGQALPAGAWTAPAIVYRGFMGEVITALLAAIAQPLSPGDVPAYVPVAPEDDPVLAALHAVTEKQGQRKTKTKRWKVALLIFRIVMLLFYVVGALGWFHVTSNFHYQPPHSVPASKQYFTVVPGPCGGKNDDWAQGGNDSYTCQANGLVMTQSTPQYVGNMWLNFDYQDHTTPAAYRVETHASIAANATDDVCAGLSVHNADGNSGAQNFWACASGMWFVSRWTTDGSNEGDLADGYLPRPSADVALRVDVIGPVMTFFINGMSVDTVIDHTYTVTNAIALDVWGRSQANDTPTATFSQFRYTPLFYNDAYVQSTLATSQAQQQPKLHQGYHAAVPGVCDPQGHAWWGPLSVANGPNAPFHCQSHGFEMRRGMGAQTLTEELFYWHNGLFPSNYRTGVTVDLSHSNGGCAGLLTRAHGYAGYSYQICPDGTWQYYYYSAFNGAAITLASGKVAAHATYRMSVTDLGGLHTLMIDGKKITTQEDDDYTDTEFVALVLNNTYGKTSDAVFSDFSYAPLFAQGS